MSTHSTEVKELFLSMTQPLHYAIFLRNGLSQKNVDFDRKVLSTPETKFPRKKELRADKWLMGKYLELEALEKKNFEMLMGILSIFSNKEFQNLFKENQIELALLKKSCEYIKAYGISRNKIFQKNQKEALTPMAKMEALYTTEYLKLQTQLVFLLLPELFALSEVFKIKRVKKKLERYFNKESKKSKERKSGINITFDPKVFILVCGVEGDILATVMQGVTRRTLVLREIMEGVAEGSEEEKKLKEIYKYAEEATLFANEMMQAKDKITTQINKDPFCLRELLAEEETYKIILDMVDKKDKQKRRALLFLHDLSVLIKEGYFESDDFSNKSVIVAFALKHAVSSEITGYMRSRDQTILFQALISKVKRSLEKIEPILIQFVMSPYFVERAKLKPGEKETDEKYQQRLNQRIKNGGECIDLFCAEERRKVRKKEESTEVKKPLLVEMSVHSIVDKSIRRPTSASAANTNAEKSAKKVKKKSGKSPLKVAGLLAPFLALTLIPFVGLIVPVTCFVVLGIAGLAYYAASDSDKETEMASRQHKNIHIKEAKDDKIVGMEGKQQDLIIDGRKLTTREYSDRFSEKNLVKKDVLSADKTHIKRNHLSMDPNHCPGIGRWFEEDEKRRHVKSAGNDSVSMSHFVSASEGEEDKRQYSLLGKSDSDLSGYRSFSEIDDSDWEEIPIDNITSYRYGSK